MNTPFQSNQFCSVLSEQAGEALIGSAPYAETYLLLEYADAPGKNALEESFISQEVKVYLNAQLKTLTNARLLLIRGPYQPYDSGPRFFLAVTKDTDTRLYQFKLKNYEKLIELDLQAVLNSNTANDPHRVNEPLYIVCTNGKRDACCAKFGLPIYNNLNELCDGSVWQGSHFAGHRFAANLLILPQGLMYGRLGTQSAVDVVEAFQRGEIDLTHLRGRVAYPAVVQVAEFFLRQKTGEMQINAFNYQESTEIGPGLWQIKFLTENLRKRYSFSIRVAKTDLKVYESCQSENQAAITRYDWIESSV